MKRLLLAGALTSFATTGFAALGVDVYGGVNIWNQKPTGDFSRHKENRVDLKGDLGFSSDTRAVVYGGVEHFIPGLPNARLRYMGVNDSSTGTLSSATKFGGTHFSAGDAVRGSYNLDMTDLTLYYSPLKTIVQLDVGLTIRHVNTHLKLNGAKESADKVAPLIHVGLMGDLPFSGFYAGGEINGISYSGNRFYDTTFKAGWRSPYLVGVEVGYTQLKLKLDNASKLDTDIEFKGPYMGVNVKF